VPVLFAIYLVPMIASGNLLPGNDNPVMIRWLTLIRDGGIDALMNLLSSEDMKTRLVTIEALCHFACFMELGEREKRAIQAFWMEHGDDSWPLKSIEELYFFVDDVNFLKEVDEFEMVVFAVWIIGHTTIQYRPFEQWKALLPAMKAALERCYKYEGELQDRVLEIAKRAEQKFAVITMALSGI